MKKKKIQPNGEQLKLDGIERVSQHNKDWVNLIIPLVVKTASLFREFTMDDVRDLADSQKIPPPVSFRAWGSVMSIASRRGLIEPVICLPRKSSRPSNHARPQAVWRRKP